MLVAVHLVHGKVQCMGTSHLFQGGIKMICVLSLYKLFFELIHSAVVD